VADSHPERLITRLRRDANDLQAYTELKNYYRQRRDFVSLLNLVQGWAGQSKDQKAASNAYYEAAEIALQKIDDPDRAKNLLQQALQSYPLNTKASESLESLLNEFGEFHELAGLLDHQIHTLEASRFDPNYLALLEYRLAALWNKQFQHSELALDHYYRAIQFDPSLLIAIYEAREICLNNRELEKAADLNQMEADAEINPRRKAALFRELATLYSSELNDLDNAVNALKAAEEATPGDVEIIHDLASYLIQRAATTGPRQAAADCEHAAQLYCQLAQRSPNQTALRYLEVALGYAPANEKALSQLEALADEMGMRHLLPPYWVEYIATADNGPLVDQRRVNLAKVYLESGQENEAVFCLQQASDRGNSEAVGLLNDLYAKTGRTPVMLDIDALNRSAQSDKTSSNDVTRTGPLPEEETAVDKSELNRLLDEPLPDDFDIEEIEELDLEPDAEEENRADLDIDFNAIARSDAESEIKIDPDLSESEQSPERADRPLDTPASDAPAPPADRPSSISELKERLMRKRESQRAARIAASMASQSEPESEQKPSQPAVTKPGLESLSELLSNRKRTAGRDLPVLSIPTPVSKPGDELSQSKASEPEPEDLQSTVPPPFRGDKIRRGEEESPEQKVHGSEPAPLESATPSKVSTPSEVSSMDRSEKIRGSEEESPEQKVHGSEPAPLESATPSKVSTPSEASSVEGQAVEPKDATVDTSQQIDVLFKQMQQAIAARHKDEAERIGEQIIAIAPSNPQAYSFLEIAYRRRQQYDKLRELLIRSTDDPGLSGDNRKIRLREAAGISQNKLKDIDGAIDIWNTLLEIDPEDGTVKQALKRSLENAERWDDLVAMLDKEAMTTTDSELEADLMEQIVYLHREKRHDKEEEIIALRQLYALRPFDKEVRNTLCDALLEVGSSREAISFLREQIAESADQKTVVQLSYKLASLFEKDLEDIETAYQVYRQILTIAPDDLPALDNMERIDRQVGNFDRLLKTLEMRVAIAPKNQLAGLYVRMGDVAEHDLSDRDTAADYLNQALALEPSNTDIFTRLYDLLEQSERYYEMVELHRDRLKSEIDRDKHVAIYHQMAELLIEKLDDQDAAAKVYRSILRITDDLEALRFLRIHAHQHDDTKRLVKILAKLVEVETDPKECCELLYEYGRLLNTRMKRPNDAIVALRRLLNDFDPQFEPAIEELLVASEKIGDPSVRVEALERQIAIETDPTTKIRLARQIAELYLSEIKDSERAIAAYRHWTEVDAVDPEPRRQLVTLLRNEQRYKELVAVFDELAVLEPDEQARSSAVVEASQLLFEELNDVDQAWERLLVLVDRQDPVGDEAICSLAARANRMDALCDLFAQSGRYRKLDEVLTGQAEAEQSPETRTALYRRIARLRSERLRDEQAAFEAWLRVLEISEDVEALEFLRGWAIQKDDVAQLEDILKRLALLESNPDERRDLMFDRSQILTTRLDRTKEAIAILNEILDTLDPEYQPAIDALVTACEATGDVRGLASALERQFAIEKLSDARVYLAQKLSEIYQTELNDSTGAVRCLRLWAQADSIDPEPHRRLRTLLQESNQFEQLVATLDELAQLETVEANRIEVTLKAAEIAFRELKDSDGAWQRVLPLVEQRSEAADETLIWIATETDRFGDLYDVFERAGKHRELVGFLRRDAESEQNEDKRVEHYRRIARLLSDQLQDETGAVEAWHKLLEIREDSEALGALRWQIAKSDDAEALADILKRMAALQSDAMERRDLLFEYARLLTASLGRPQEALDVLKEILQLDPKFEQAIDEFVAVTDVLGDRSGMAEALERQLAINRDPAIRADLASRLSEIYLSQENQEKRAIAALTVWCQADSGDPKPRRELCKLLEKTRRYRELVAVLDELAALEEDLEQRVEAELSAAELEHKKLRNLDGAWKRYVAILEYAPGRVEQAVCHIAREIRREEELAGIYTRLAQQSNEAQISANHWYHAAQIFENDLGQPEQAFEAALRRLATDLKNSSYLEEVERLAATINAWPRLAQVYNRIIAQTEDKRDKARLLVRHADLLDERAKNPDAAFERIIQANALDPDNGQLLDRAEELSLLANSTEDFITVFERRINSAANDRERVEHLLRIAPVVDTRLRDREQAKEYIARAVKLSKSSPEIVDRIEETARSMDKKRPDLGRTDVLRTVVQGYQETVARTLGKNDPTHLLRTARLLSEELNDDSTAFEILRQGVNRFPTDRDVYSAAERVAIKIRRLDALDATLSRVLSQNLEKETNILILENRARLIKQRLNRYDEAADVYTKILKLDPEHEEAKRALRACLEKGGRYIELVRLLEKQLSDTADQSTQLGLMKEIAAIWERQLVNRWEAIEVWKKVQDRAPDDKEAREALERLQKASLSSIRPIKA